MYIVICLWLLIFVLTFILLKLLNINKNYFVSFLITIFIILFIVNIKVSITAALTGVNLVLKAIVPTIFPFSVICNLLIYYDGISLYSKIFGPLICKPLKLSKNSSFPIAASIICGYPLGCKYSVDLYNLGYISQKELQRLLNIASNASPMFLIGSIGASMLGNPTLGLILLLGNYISALLIGVITRPKKYHMDNYKEFTSVPTKTNVGDALKSSIENGINTTLQVGAFVVIFSIVIAIIKNSQYINTMFLNLENFLKLPKESLYGLFLGSIEFTNGCKIITSSSLSIALKLSIISFICSFSGLSVIAQITSFLGKCNVSLKKYIFYKFLQGIFSFIITYLFSILLIKSSPVSTIDTWPLLLNNKLYFIPLTILLVTLIVTLVSKVFKKLHVS